jgi:hypothetical protein
MPEAPTVTGPVCTIHQESMAGGRACQACLASPVLDDDEEPGFYEDLSATATDRGMPDRLAVEMRIWKDADDLLAIADECAAEAAALKREKGGELGAVARSKSWRATKALEVKAREAAGKAARAAGDMILFRERCAYNERADRLYAERQRAVSRSTH